MEARLAQKEAQLTALYAAALAAIPNSEISQYEFDSGEGRQRLWRRSPAVMQDAIDRLEKEIDALYAKLEGTGLSRVTFRRGV
jgi:hypothetical protein